jgi:hypothetical protein
LEQQIGSIQHDGEGGNKHGYGDLNAKFAKKRKGPKGCFVIFASEFVLAGFALKRMWDKC